MEDANENGFSPEQQERSEANHESLTQEDILSFARIHNVELSMRQLIEQLDRMRSEGKIKTRKDELVELGRIIKQHNDIHQTILGDRPYEEREKTEEIDSLDSLLTLDRTTCNGNHTICQCFVCKQWRRNEID